MVENLLTVKDIKELIDEKPFYFCGKKCNSNNFTYKYECNNTLMCVTKKFSSFCSRDEYDDSFFYIRLINSNNTPRSKEDIRTEFDARYVHEQNKLTNTNNTKNNISVLKNNIDVYDILVFEDVIGSIYQDCVKEIIVRANKTIYRMNGAIYVQPRELITNKDDNAPLFKYYLYGPDKDGKESFTSTGWMKNNYVLKEIWKRTNENTYTKIEVEQ